MSQSGASATQEEMTNAGGIDTNNLTQFLKRYIFTNTHSLTQAEIEFMSGQKLAFGLHKKAKLADLMIKNSELISRIIISYSHPLFSVTKKLHSENQRIPSMHALCAAIKASADTFKLASHPCVDAILATKISPAANANNSLQRMWKLYAQLSSKKLDDAVEMYNSAPFQQVLLSLERTPGNPSADDGFSPYGANASLKSHFAFGMKRYQLKILHFKFM